MSTFDPDSEAARRRGNLIRQRRRELNMSQKELAKHMGTSQEIISNYETGSTAIKAADLPRIAKLLGVSLAYFYGVSVFATLSVGGEPVIPSSREWSDPSAEILRLREEKEATLSQFRALSEESQGVVMRVSAALTAQEKNQEKNQDQPPAGVQN